MALSRRRSRRKISGGRYKPLLKRSGNQHQLPSLVSIGKRRIKRIRIRAGKIKLRLLTMSIVNLYDPFSKKHFLAKIESVVESPSNRNFIRRNIMMKGSVIKTDKGLARITSRPGQEGSINAVLLRKV